MYKYNAEKDVFFIIIVGPSFLFMMNPIYMYFLRKAAVR